MLFSAVICVFQQGGIAPTDLLRESKMIIFSGADYLFRCFPIEGSNRNEDPSINPQI